MMSEPFVQEQEEGNRAEIDVVSLLTRSRPEPGVGDLWCVGPDEDGERLAETTARLLGAFRAGEPVFPTVHVVLPPAAAEGLDVPSLQAEVAHILETGTGGETALCLRPGTLESATRSSRQSNC
jgi:hypothetical protein